MACIDIDIFKTFEMVEKISQHKLKLQELEKIKSCKITQRIFELVYDKNIIFGVGEVTLNKVKCGNRHTTSFTEFENIIKYLTGQRKGYKDTFKILNAFFSKTSPLSCKWYKRILLKDLKIGIGEELLSVLYNGNNLDVLKPSDQNISPMLGEEFYSYFDKKDILKTFRECSKWFIEPKLDGVRAIILVHSSGSFKVLSRNSKRLPIIEELIKNDIEKLYKTLKVYYKDGFVLDGELYGKNWNDTMTKVFTRKNVDINALKSSGIKYYVFDLLNYKSFILKQQTEKLSERKNKLFKYIKKLQFIKVIPHKILNTTSIKNDKHILDILQVLLNKSIKQGYEGIMIKCSEASYMYKRSYYWLKLKQTFSDDFIVVDVIKKSKVPGQAGAIIIDVDGIQTRVGSGLSDNLRKCIYNYPEDIIGEYVEVAYQEKTKDGKLRFPRLLRVRIDKSKNKNKKYNCLLKNLTWEVYHGYT